MSRASFLALAAQNLRMPIGADLILHQQPDPEAILLDGRRLGDVIAQAARTFGTPLAFPVMDLKLEKAWLLSLLGIPAGEWDTYHFATDPGADAVTRLQAGLRTELLPPRVAANIAASELPPLTETEMQAVENVYDEMIRPLVHHLW